MSEEQKQDNAKAYWAKNVRLMVGLLVIWFVVSFGCGILFVDQLNEFRIGGYKLGFWFAQQGQFTPSWPSFLYMPFRCANSTKSLASMMTSKES